MYLLPRSYKHTKENKMNPSTSGRFFLVIQLPVVIHILHECWITSFVQFLVRELLRPILSLLHPLGR